MLKHLRDPIWQFVSAIIGLVTLFAMIALAIPTFWEFVRQWRLHMVVALLLLGVVISLLVPRSRRFIVEAWTAASQRFKAAYVRVLWYLVVRPARDHLKVMVEVESDVERAELATDLHDAVPKLSNDAVQVLEVILDKYDPASSTTVIRPSFVPLHPFEVLPGKRNKRVVLACDELKSQGFIAGFESYGGKYGSKMVIALGAGLPSGAVLKMLEWVEDEVISRDILLRQWRSPSWPAPPRQLPTERVRM